MHSCLARGLYTLHKTFAEFGNLILPQPIHFIFCDMFAPFFPISDFFEVQLDQLLKTFHIFIHFIFQSYKQNYMVLFHRI